MVITKKIKLKKGEPGERVGAILRKTRLGRFLRREKGTAEYVEAIYPRGRKEELLWKIWGQRVGIIFLLAVSAALVWLACFLSEPETEQDILSEGRYVARQGDDSSLKLQVRGNTDGKKWEDEFSVHVKSRQFTDEEKTKLAEKVREYAEKTLPGENETLEKVSKPLNFVGEIPGTGAELRWVWEEKYLKESGAMIASHIPENGADTEVMLEAEWKNWKESFYFPVHLEAPQYSSEERIKQSVRKKVKEVLKKGASQEKVELPAEVENTSVEYSVPGEKKSYLPVWLFVAVILAMPFLWRERQKRKLQAREEQMMSDHPGIVNRVMLLLSAGLTMRKTVERLADEYEENRKKGGEVRYVYEEICIMLQEMRDGVSEGRAVERFGRRCRLLPYLRFSSVISQNLKKGAEGLIDILEKESMEALEERKERALRMGEKAGTKLLFPMMLMLGLVMGIIMVPAFMTM